MRTLALCAALFAATTTAFAGPQESELRASAHAAIEKAVLEVNAQMTRAAEDRDIDRLFSFMLPTDRGSIIQSGNLFQTREEALATVKRNFQGVAAIKYRWKRQLVTVISATTALLVCDGESEVRTAQDPPATFVTPFAQSVLFVLTDGKWKALHAHMSTVPR
jgi:mannose/cellobiose epimerase-like protein (N-acyl-D-glucosamine 2-epimerase family)